MPGENVRMLGKLFRRLIGGLLTLFGTISLVHGNSYPEDHNRVDIAILVYSTLLIGVGLYLLLGPSNHDG